MKLTVQGIVIQCIRYSDQKLIVKMFCNKLGYKTGMARVSKRPSNNNIHLFQPLRIVEFETDFQEQNKFIQLNQPRIATPLHSIGIDPVKTAMTLFMDELLAITIADEYTNDDLFRFLKNSIVLLDDAINPNNFHLWWLIEITRYYGFYPTKSAGMYFDLQQAEFTNIKPPQSFTLEPPISDLLFSLLDLEWPQAQVLELNGSIRNQLLHALIQFLRIHLNINREIKSLDVLHAVFH
jgi:DNA repair protein RecO (recombination protein O)